MVIRSACPLRKASAMMWLGPHGDDLDLVAVPGCLLKSLRQGLPEPRFHHAANDGHADLPRGARQNARALSAAGRQGGEEQDGRRLKRESRALHCVLSDLARVQRARSRARSVSVARN